MTARAWAVSLVLVVAACTASPAASPTPQPSPAPSLTPVATVAPSTAPPVLSDSPKATDSPGPTRAATPEPGTVEAVRADVDNYVSAMERSHKSLFSYVPEGEWRQAVGRLHDLIPELVPDQPERLMVEIVRLMQLPGVRGGRHGHVSAEPPTDRPALAIVTYTFGDGMFVTRAGPDQQDLIGSRVLAVAGYPIDEVRDLLTPLVKHDNEWTPETWLIDWLRLPEVLVGIGLIDDVGPVEFELELPGGEVRSVDIPLLDSLEDLQPAPPPLSWATREAYDIVVLHYLPERPDALWTSRMGEPLWWTTLDDGVTLYVQQNLVEPPAAADVAPILAAAGEPQIERVILDLRHNMGGDDNGVMSRTFSDPVIDQPGRLYVITSNNVYSATTFIVDDLDQTTDAIFVGEPMGGAPDALSGSSMRLNALPIPLTVSIPSTSGQFSDRPLTVAPDIQVPLLASDYFADHDAALEAILER